MIIVFYLTLISVFIHCCIFLHVLPMSVVCKPNCTLKLHYSTISSHLNECCYNILCMCHRLDVLSVSALVHLLNITVIVFWTDVYICFVPLRRETYEFFLKTFSLFDLSGLSASFVRPLFSYEFNLYHPENKLCFGDTATLERYYFFPNM